MYKDLNPAMHKKKLDDRGATGLILIIIVVILIILGMLYFIFLYNQPTQNSNSTTTTLAATPTTTGSATLYECNSTTSDVPQDISDYEIELFAVENAQDGSSGETKLSSFPATSLTEFEASEWPKYDVVYNVVKDKIMYTGFWGVTTGMEVCDENNMTNMPLDPVSEVDVIPEDSPAASAASYIFGGHIPAKPGTYRVDGYLFMDGAWHLTHRLENVTFTK